MTKQMRDLDEEAYKALAVLQQVLFYALPLDQHSQKVLGLDPVVLLFAGRIHRAASHLY